VGIGPAEPELPSEAVGDALDVEVLIAGAGPVGCWLAAELCAAGVRVLVLEARQSRVAWSRGFVIHPRTLEIFETRGVAKELVPSGLQRPAWHFAMGPTGLDFTVLPTSFPFVLLQPQARTEELLEAHLNRCGGEVLRGHRVLGVMQDADRVRVRVQHEGAEREVSARFVVGCDGARSTVRQTAGIGFTGNADTLVSPSALAELADPPPPEQYMQTLENGAFLAIPLPDGRFVVSTVDHAVMHEVDVQWTAEMLRESMVRLLGTDYGLREVERVSTLGNATWQAERYREGRVLLAGDAAHVHFPMGGQGMNLGVQDAHDLAWRLIAAVRAQRETPEATDAPIPAAALLDGYEAERRAVGERVLEDVRAQMALVAATGADGAALRSRFVALLSEHAAVNRQYAMRLSGLAVRYPVPGEESDPRCGARVPDLELELSDGAVRRLYELLRELGAGHFLRLEVAGEDGAPTTASASVDADADAAAFAGAATTAVVVRRVLGPDGALGAGWGGAESVLIRPDGHLAAVHGRDEHCRDA
jgi:2-polyprenyl-6-methoxyphenol hydroxylase-like FAD-dependent oxidoreductase